MIVLFGAASGPVPPFDLQRLNAAGALFTTRPSLAHYTLTGDEVSWRAGEIFGWLAEGAVQLSVNQRFALADAADAHRALESRATTGKTVRIPKPWCPLKHCHHRSTYHTDDDKQRHHRGGSLFASSASPVARVLRYRIVQFPRLSHRRTAPNAASAAEMAARRACEASSAVKVRSGARKRRLKDRKSTRLNSSHVSISYAV